MQSQQLTIGVPVSNEAKALPTFLVSLSEAIEHLSFITPSSDIEVLFCINNTTDNSKNVILEYIKKHNLNWTVLECRPGKICALQCMTSHRKNTGYICFIDADVILHRESLFHLFKSLTANPDVFLVYSSMIPNYGYRKTLVQHLQSFHYDLREQGVNPRRYFHGRTYMMRSDELIKNEINDTHHLKESYVDDIYYSRIIVHEKGLESIKEIPDAKVYFVPTKSLRDFYFENRRQVFEIHRLNQVYPQHAHIQKNFFNKKVYWGKLLARGIVPFAKYGLYHSVEKLTKMMIKGEIYLISKKVIKNDKIWVPLTTTKSFN